MDAEALVRPVIEQAGFEFVELANNRLAVFHRQCKIVKPLCERR